MHTTSTLPLYDPPALEVTLTLGLGLTLLSPYYRSFSRQLSLRGSERILDFGSGSGICSRHIAARLQRGGQLDCVDISPGWMQVLRRSLRRFDNVAYHLGQITQLDLPQAAYDLVVLHFVLHDIPSAEHPRLIHALARKLKPGGRLFLREPQGHGLTPQYVTNLAAKANLQPVSLKTHRVAFLSVYDLCYTPAKELS
jgi:ubiquinone/menaquinone biosynthesis C-methylase UbiE